MNETRNIAFAYVPSRHRDAVNALWALDSALGRAVASMTEPLVGQMRLTWWHDQLSELGAGTAPAEPVLMALHAVVQHTELTGAQLAQLVEGWEHLLEPMPFDDALLTRFGQMRGNHLYEMSARVMNASVATDLGAGWSLMDFAVRCSDPLTSKRAQRLARAVLGKAANRGPKFLRILAHLAKARASRPFERITEPVSRRDMLIAVLR